MDPRIVANVDDGSQLMIGVCFCLGAELPEAEQLLDSQQEAGAADPTDQNGDLHIARQYCPATMRSAGLGVPALAGDGGTDR